LLDYTPSELPKYIEAFFSNIDWEVVEKRLQEGAAKRRQFQNSLNDWVTLKGWLFSIS
jgi:hypothetical protein